METVYLNTDGTVELTLTQDDGTGKQVAAINYAPSITRITLKIGLTTLDSTLNPQFFDYISKAGEAKVILKLGQSNIPAGIYKNCILKTYDLANDDGIVWSRSLEFEFFDEEGVSLAFDATKGGINANTYATITEADALLNNQYGSEEWMTLDNNTKARLLMSATESIDFMPIMTGKLDAGQALRFPIVAADGDDGFEAAKKACIHQAMFLFTNGETIAEALNGRIQGVRQEVISKIQKTTIGYQPMAKYAPKALSLLAKYVDFGVRVFRS